MINKLDKATIGTKITIGDRKVPYEIKDRDNRYLVCIGKRFDEPDHIILDLQEKTMGLVLDYRDRNTLNNQRFPAILLRLLNNNDVEIIEKTKRKIIKEKILIHERSDD